MRFHRTIVTGLAGLSLAPALTAHQERLEALEEALARTARSLEVVERIQEQGERAGDELPVVILAATEPATLDDDALDERLGTLRYEVGSLRAELDLLERGRQGPLGVPGHAPGRTALQSPPAERGSVPPRIPLELTPPSVGLDPGLIGRMRQQLRPERAAHPARLGEQPARSGAAPSARHRATHVELDATGYSAAPLSQARACYHAGRYEDGLTLLEDQHGISADQLRARCLTRLERYDEAIATLTRIVEAAGSGYEAERATSDLEFVRWRKEFSEKLSARDVRPSGN